MALKINNRLTSSYTFDDYLKDKEKNAGQITPSSTSVAGMAGRMPTATRVESGQIAAPSSQNAVISTPVSTPTPTPTPTPTGTGGGKTESSGLTAEQIRSAFVTNDMQNAMNSTLQEIFKMGQRGFVYNEKDSPLYAILQQQAAKEARIASGRAYSRAVANAGGFGSSYATLAAEEASRQVMEGWDDNQLALYQAAKEEWESQYQSKIDQYNFLKGEVESADALFTSAVSALRTAYGPTYDEAAMTADLQAMGLNEEQIKAVLANQKQYSDAMASSSLTAQSAIEDLRGKYGEDEYNEEQMRLYLGSLNYSEEAINEALSYWKQYSDTVNETKEPDVISDTAQDVLAEWQAQYGTTYSEGLMRAFFAGRGYSEEAINEAVNAQRDVAKGELFDQAAMVKTYQDAATYGEMLNEARRSKIISDSEWESAMRKNSEILRREYVGAGSLSAETLDEAAEMVRNQIMTKSDFEDILKNIFEDKLGTVWTEVNEKFNNLAECKKVMNLVISLFEFVDDGTLTEDDLKAFIKPFGENSTFTAFMIKMQSIEGDDDTIDRLDNAWNSDYKRAWTLIKDAMG